MFVSGKLNFTANSQHYAGLTDYPVSFKLKKIDPANHQIDC